MENKLKILMVKTNNGCFISDCLAVSGYDWSYHHSKIDELYFDGEKPTPTYLKNWLSISKYPDKITRLLSQRVTNERYEIDDTENITKKFPAVIPKSEKTNYDEDLISSLYTYKYDNLPDEYEDVDLDIQVICEVEDFPGLPNTDFEAVRKADFKDRLYHITSKDIHHQMLDKMIFPEILLSERPCRLSSKQVYDITRQYVRENIDGSKAKITSDYNFCFEVKKIVPLLEPETISYQNLFAETKREREKIRLTNIKNKELSIFQMTHDEEKYKGHTPISAITAPNERELKAKVVKWLTGLINIINKPLTQCEHCKGTGYVGDIERIEHWNILREEK